MSTVSNVLSGRHEQMAVETRERVLAAIASLNYQPTRAARSLVTKRTATTRLIMSDLTDSLSPPIILSAEFVCRNAGHSLPLVNTLDLKAERAAVETMRANQVDGPLFSVSMPTSRTSTSTARKHTDKKEVRMLEIPLLIREISTSHDRRRIHTVGSLCKAAGLA